ncbi:hypothetical protein GTS_30050 [Gandjariella thermophila]|uniref:Uncharacterized protein n=2 Tax=Gandjariella thermophila TaxID=1931992 RepID=A0A4D4J833_9PSEU|nr:hypothetical protein GTS_30050 [Gandjariella thermophila]
MWRVPGSNTFGVSVSDKLGIGDLDISSGRLSTITVGRHEGRKLEEGSGPGNCDVAIAVSATSRALITAVAGQDTAKACDVAMRVANAIEPKLP